MEQAAEQVQRQAIKDAVSDFLVNQGHVAEEVAANGETKLAGLGIDSLSMVEMVYELEDKYGIQVEDMNPLKDMTIDGLIDFVHSLAVKKAAGDRTGQEG